MPHSQIVLEKKVRREGPRTIRLRRRRGKTHLDRVDFHLLPLLLSLSLQVCDKEWHHYVLNVEFPSVALFVDGATFEPFLVTEDYPLHSSKIDMQLTIGACWQGKLAWSQIFVLSPNIWS